LVCSIYFCNFNIRSIGTKHRFDHIIEKIGGNYDIITISETWLKDDIPQTSFNLNDYSKPLRLDRPEGKAGGVMCYVKSSMTSKARPDLGINSLELLWVEITIKNHKLLVGTCYRQSGAK
jgi:exonuclease III